MTREQFCTLAGLLYDAHAGGGGGAPASRSSAPSGGGDAPRFDAMISRKGGMIQWASECSAKELRYQIGRAEQTSDPKYADANAAQAKRLGYWLAWREANPDALWSGERNRQRVTAAPPADKPPQYPRPSRDGGNAPPANAQPTPDFSAGAADDSDIPFAPRTEP